MCCLLKISEVSFSNYNSLKTSHVMRVFIQSNFTWYSLSSSHRGLMPFRCLAKRLCSRTNRRCMTPRVGCSLTRKSPLKTIINSVKGSLSIVRNFVTMVSVKAVKIKYFLPQGQCDALVSAICCYSIGYVGIYELIIFLFSLI